MVDTIKVTLETLYDILRTEKKKEELQQLEETFFIDVVTYMREKKALLDQKEENENIFAGGENEKLEYELRSIKRILKEIYEKREKKILEIAMNKSRTGSDIIDTGSMLKEEKEFYVGTLGWLDKYRKGVLYQLFKGNLPDISGMREQINVKVPLQPIVKPKVVESPKKENGEEDQSEMTKVRFTNPMPSFVWKDMKVYGPYEVGEEIEIFPEVAALLVRKGRAENV